jgi:integrase
MLPTLYAVVPCRTRGRHPLAFREAGLAKAAKPRVLHRVRAEARLRPCLLDGSGPRLRECCRLRVQDIAFARSRIVIRGGKGDKDRVPILPAVLKADLARHLQTVRTRHDRDFQQMERSGYSTRSATGWTALPHVIAPGRTCTAVHANTSYDAANFGRCVHRPREIGSDSSQLRGRYRTRDRVTEFELI